MRSIINGLFSTDGLSLVSIVVKATIVIVGALLLVWLRRGSAAAVRHVFLAASFAMLLVLPIASFLAPSIHIPVPIATRASSLTGLFEDIQGTATPVSQSLQKPVPTLIAQSSEVSGARLVALSWVVVSMLFALPVSVGLWQLRTLRRSGVPWLPGQSLVDALGRGNGNSEAHHCSTARSDIRTNDLRRISSDCFSA